MMGGSQSQKRGLQDESTAGGQDAFVSPDVVQTPPTANRLGNSTESLATHLDTASSFPLTHLIKGRLGKLHLHSADSCV
jgi:hypothetical protein